MFTASGRPRPITEAVAGRRGRAPKPPELHMHFHIRFLIAVRGTELMGEKEETGHGRDLSRTRSTSSQFRDP